MQVLKCNIKIGDSPLRSGTADHTVMGPQDEYCPTLSSRRKAGIPTHINMMK